MVGSEDLYLCNVLCVVVVMHVCIMYANEQVFMLIALVTASFARLQSQNVWLLLYQLCNKLPSASVGCLYRVLKTTNH